MIIIIHVLGEVELKRSKVLTLSITRVKICLTLGFAKLSVHGKISMKIIQRLERERMYFIYIKMNKKKGNQFKRGKKWGAWPAQSGDRGTLDLGVVTSSPMLGVEIT